MPTLRYCLVMIALVLGIYSLASAQTTRPADEALPKGAEKLQDAISKLDLTPDQKKQVQALKDEIAESVRGIAPQLKDASPDERREKIRQAVGNVREKFLSILTPEQKQQLRENMDSSRIPGRKPLADLKADHRESLADEVPTTAPATKPAERGRKDADTPMIARMRQVIDGLGLSDDQKTKTDAILDDAHDQILKLRQDAGGDREAARGKVQELTASIRQKLAAVLTPDQQQKLREQLPGRGGGAAGQGAGRRNGAGRGNGPGTQPANSTNTPDPSAAKAAAASLSASSQPTRPTAGDAAPDFTVKRLSGSTVTRTMLAGKPLVLVFGSLTSPSFRDRFPQLEALQNRYRSRINLLIVYTREAHPADGWQVDRNSDAKVQVKAPTTFDERMALAKKMHDLSKTQMDIAVDSIEDATVKAFGDTIEGAVVVSPYGTVIGTQTFCDPSGLPRMIDLALASKE